MMMSIYLNIDEPPAPVDDDEWRVFVKCNVEVAGKPCTLQYWLREGASQVATRPSLARVLFGDGEYRDSR